MPVRIGRHTLGDGHPVYVVAEIGVNHNGSVGLATDMIEKAVAAGCDAVKFQARTPELSVPEHLRDQLRDSPFGRVTHLEHRRRMEFDTDAWEEIADYCELSGIDWFASCWDIPSVERMSRFPMVAHKVASACLTNTPLVEAMSGSGLPVVMSTGMAWRDLVKAMAPFADVLCHTVSAYPCPNEELNLNALWKGLGPWLSGDQVLGYSGHEDPGDFTPTLAAVALGARYIERHFTTDPMLPGSDQKISLTWRGMGALVDKIRRLERAMGDGEKRIRDCERPALERLRPAVMQDAGPELV